MDTYRQGTQVLAMAVSVLGESAEVKSKLMISEPKSWASMFRLTQPQELCHNIYRNEENNDTAPKNAENQLCWRTMPGPLIPDENC